MFKNICINNLRLLSILFAILISVHASSFEYMDGLVSLSDPGQTPVQSPPQYFYYTKDHLGNIRSVVTKNPSTNVISEVQRTHYYPYGGIIVETKLRDTTPMSKGQRAAEKHVKDNNKMFEVRTQIEQFRLNPGNEILVTDFKPIYKYSK